MKQADPSCHVVRVSAGALHHEARGADRHSSSNPAHSPGGRARSPARLQADAAGWPGEESPGKVAGRPIASGCRAPGGSPVRYGRARRVGPLRIASRFGGSACAPAGNHGRADSARRDGAESASKEGAVGEGAETGAPWSGPFHAHRAIRLAAEDSYPCRFVSR